MFKIRIWRLLIILWQSTDSFIAHKVWWNNLDMEKELKAYKSWNIGDVICALMILIPIFCFISRNCRKGDSYFVQDYVINTVFFDVHNHQSHKHTRHVFAKQSIISIQLRIRVPNSVINTNSTISSVSFCICTQ